MRRVGHTAEGHAGDTVAVHRSGCGCAVTSEGADADGQRSLSSGAVGHHREGVVRLGGQAGGGVGGSSDIRGNQRVVAQHRVGGTGVVAVGPGEGHAVGGEAAHGKVMDCGTVGHHGNGNVVDMEVVVAAAPEGLGVEGNLYGAAHILVQVDDLVLVGGAGQRSVGVVTCAVLPHRGIGGRPGVATIGGDDDHEGLRGVGVAIGIGQGGVVVVGEGDIERELCRGGVGQVDVGRDHPAQLAGAAAVDVLVVVACGQTVSRAAGICPLRRCECQRRAGKDLGGRDARGTAPADAVGKSVAEVFDEGHCLGAAVGVGSDSHDR